MGFINLTKEQNNMTLKQFASKYNIKNLDQAVDILEDWIFLKKSGLTQSIVNDLNNEISELINKRSKIT